MPHEPLNEAVGTWIVALPAACGAVLGWIGHAMVKDDPTMSTRRFVGGVILSAFTGGCVCILLQSMGFPPALSAVLASAIGSSGIKGYEWLVLRSRSSVDSRNENKP